jgi:hypothetical protein
MRVRPSTFIHEIEWSASGPCLATQTLPLIYLWSLCATTQIKIRQFAFTTICTRQNGGGAPRYFSFIPGSRLNLIVNFQRSRLKKIIPARPSFHPTKPSLIGNIPKEIRRKPSRHAYVLLAYLPTSRLGHIKNKADIFPVWFQK